MAIERKLFLRYIYTKTPDNIIRVCEYRCHDRIGIY